MSVFLPHLHYFVLCNFTKINPIDVNPLTVHLSEVDTIRIHYNDLDLVNTVGSGSSVFSMLDF